MKKYNVTNKANKIVSYVMAATMMIGIVACGNTPDTNTNSNNDTTAIEEVSKEEPDTVATIIDVADVAEDSDGNIIDAISHEKLTDEEIEKKLADGILIKDKTGKITINQNKNTRKAAITIDAKTNEIVTAEAGNGKTYVINDGQITAPKNEGNVKVEVNTGSDKKKAEVTVSTTEANTENQKLTERTTIEVTTEDVAKNTTEQPKTEKKTEAPTEKKTEAPTEKRTEAPTEKKTEAPTEKKTEAPTEKKTEAPTEKKTEAPTEKRTEAPTEKKTEAPTEKKTEAPTEKKTEAPVCSHNWVWHTHTEVVHKSERYLVSDAWDEPVYEVHNFCNNCGLDLDATYGGYNDNAVAHLNSCGTGYHTGSVQVGSIHHDAIYETDEWDEYEEVKDYQYCSKCGQRK